MWMLLILLSLTSSPILSAAIGCGPNICDPVNACLEGCPGGANPSPSSYHDCILSKTAIDTKIRRTDICETSKIVTGYQSFSVKNFDSTEPEIFILQTGRISDLCLKQDQLNMKILLEAVIQNINNQAVALGLDKLNQCPVTTRMNFTFSF